MNIEKALTIRGWMNDHELAWLAEKAKDALVTFEIGCAWGRSTRALADNAPIIGQIIAIDTWAGSPDELETHHAEFALEGGDFVYAQFLANLWDHIRCNNVTPFRMHSSNAARLLIAQKQTADFIFIDGNHSFAGVASDIENFRGLVAPGGTLAGHDYDDNHWPGVVKAVDECLTSVTRGPGTIWIAKI